MVSTFTTNRLYEKPATGDQVGTWGATVNTNWDYVDSNIGGTQSLSLSSSNVTLSAAQARNLIYSLTGTLTANVTITWPARGGFFIIDNNTTGAFNVTCASAGGGANCLATQAKRTLIMVSATDCKLADDRAATGGGGSGSVTSVSTSGYVTGGPITSTGTIQLGSMGAASRLLGSAAGAATITDISLGTFLSMSSSTLKVSDLSSTSQLIGSSASAATATNITLGNRLTMSAAQLKVADMSAVSRIMGSSDASAAVTDLIVGTGLQISGSTLSCTVTQGASTSTTITGTGYLTGGGSLAANRTISMGSMSAASRIMGSGSGSATITDLTAGTGITIGASSISNSGVTSAVAGAGINVSGATGAVTISATTTGKIGQVVQNATGAVATGTTVIPLDDTIPQSSEGDQYLSQAITPVSASSTLIIDVVVVLATSAVSGFMTAALFQDAGANALAVASQYTPSNNAVVSVCFRYKMPAGTTSATTFKVRAGGNNAGTTTLNGQSGGRLWGGVAASSLTITEILP